MIGSLSNFIEVSLEVLDGKLHRGYVVSNNSDVDVNYSTNPPCILPKHSTLYLDEIQFTLLASIPDINGSFSNGCTYMVKSQSALPVLLFSPYQPIQSIQYIDLFS